MALNGVVITRRISLPTKNGERFFAPGDEELLRAVIDYVQALELKRNDALRGEVERWFSAAQRNDADEQAVERQREQEKGFLASLGLSIAK